MNNAMMFFHDLRPFIHSDSRVYYCFGVLLMISLLLGACSGGGEKKEALDDGDDDDVRKVIEVTYDEPHRPQYHFTPPAQWMNDPNGMFYYEGEYHLFYQHYPDSNVWGPMHWGHAVSRDMVKWEHLPIALTPDPLGYIFSGSAVVDWNNTSGFGSTENPPIIAIFTYHNPLGEARGTDDFQTQGIAYSLDKGRTWVKHRGNPVLANPGIKDFRDPKVFWLEEKQLWYMILAVKDHVEIYQSEDLKKWEKSSEFGAEIGAHGGVWECPDLFPLTTPDGTQKWIMLVSINPGGPQGGSATQYFVGDFDGGKFDPQDQKTRWIDYGADNYAGVTFSDIPKEDGRRLFIGWMSNWQYAQVVPTTIWRSAMTLPRELSLDKNEEGYFVKSTPVVEVDALTSQSVQVNATNYEFEKPVFHLKISDITEEGGVIELSNDLQEYVKISFSDKVISIDRTESGITDFQSAFSAKHEASLPESVRSIELFVDRSSIELFVNGGETVMTDLVFPTTPYQKLTINKKIGEVSFSPIQSIW